jgi:hypothetical protein
VHHATDSKNPLLCSNQQKKDIKRVLKPFKMLQRAILLEMRDQVSDNKDE